MDAASRLCAIDAEMAQLQKEINKHRRNLKSLEMSVRTTIGPARKEERIRAARKLVEGLEELVPNK